MRAAPRSGVVHAHGRQARWRSVGSRPPLYCHYHSHHAGEASRRDLAATADTRYARICQRRDERRHRVGLLADERGDGDVALDDVRRRRVLVDDARPCSAYHAGTVNKLHVGLSVLAFAHTILCRYTFCIHINAFAYRYFILEEMQNIATGLSMSICTCVFPLSVTKTTKPNFTNFLCIACSPGSVILFGYVDDVKLSHREGGPRYTAHQIHGHILSNLRILSLEVFLENLH